MRVPNVSPEDPILARLEARDSPIEAVRYRANRTVLLSVSRDGRTLNSHACFRDAPTDIAEAVATAVTERRDSSLRRRALRRLREWEGTRRGLEAARRGKPKRRRSVNGRETEPLRALFRRLNREQFGGKLPEIPLRVSRRMTRSLGTIRYGSGSVGDPAASADRDDGRSKEASRAVAEIVISADLLRPTNRAALKDTMLHEMAHAEAWLRHGRSGHGAIWRRIARRVGCRPRAVNDVRVAGRPGCAAPRSGSGACRNNGGVASYG